VRYRQWRTVAFDGCSSIKTPDRPSLRAVLGKARNQQGDAGYPALRLTVLCETGTRGLLAAAFGPCAVGELASATTLLSALSPQMLLLADRGFDSDAFLSAVSATGAQYLIRLRSSRRPLIEKVLPDGSYLTHLDGRPVRIIDATVTATCADGQQIGDSYLLVTSLLDLKMPSSAQTVPRPAGDARGPRNHLPGAYVQGRGALRRELAGALRTGRARRKPHRQANCRQTRFTDPMVMISDRPAEADDRAVLLGSTSRRNTGFLER
jgi:hypothetical protein